MRERERERERARESEREREKSYQNAAADIIEGVEVLAYVKQHTHIIYKYEDTVRRLLTYAHVC